MKKNKALFLTFFTILTLCITTACGRYGRLFFKKDVATQQAKMQADKTNENIEQDEIVIR